MGPVLTTVPAIVEYFQSFSAVAFVAITLATPRPEPEEIDEYIWRWELWRQETEELRGEPKWKNYRVLAPAMVAITAALVIWFW